MIARGAYYSQSIHTDHLTRYASPRLAIMMRTLGFPAVPLHGQLSQSSRLGALGKFKSGGRKVLVATDVASRCVVSFHLSRFLTDFCLT